ncbi:methionine aminotransferase [Desertivirga xinjiangensis]|uniref:methionine aminotransferase n=1 Tax=Desertivirga xinjiangensis TaxID=539206 RepID=UPI00210E77DB|nr:methionine aminotransferase [Pedobacter xinjiangensis]
MIHFRSKLPKTETTIFTVMSALATEYNAINLSQGFPDFDSPPQLIDLVGSFMKQGKNQYAPMAGLLILRNQIAEKVELLYNTSYDPETEITITAGGTQAIFTAIAATIIPGDEVIIFEPAYDSYAPSIKLLGGLVKPFELVPPDYKIDWDMVKKLISSRTRMIILNSPQNPTGVILDEEDIKQLISITKGTDILILSDEVYEHLVYDDRQHLSMARYPELKERSFVTVSFGKLFHTTGWKLGYCLAPEILMNEFRKVHQFLVFSVNTPMQYAIAEFLKNTGYYTELNSFFQQKRDYFRDLMQQTRFELLPCYGSYFQCASIKNITEEKDIDFVQRLTKEHQVAAIPASAFYNRGNDYGIVRFCFAKKQETLEKAVNLLAKV